MWIAIRRRGGNEVEERLRRGGKREEESKKKLFIASILHLQEDLENQIVTYELSKTKKPAR